MFGFNSKYLEKRCANLEKRVTLLMEDRDNLLDEVSTLGSNLKKLALTKKISEEEVAHKLKMREEQVDLQYEKKAQKVEAAADKKVAASEVATLTQVGAVKDEYRDKQEDTLNKRSDELRSMYSEILERLPDVSVNVGGATVRKSKKR